MGFHDGFMIISWDLMVISWDSIRDFMVIFDGKMTMTGGYFLEG